MTKRLAIRLTGRHPIVLEGFRAVLERERGFTVVGSGFPENQPSVHEDCDVLLLHVNPRSLRELDSIGRLVAATPFPALAFSLDATIDFVQRVLRLGVRGYLARGTGAAELVEAVEAVAAGGSWVSAELGAEMAGALEGDAEVLPHQRLTDRELDVLIALAGCDSPAEIANRLCLSEKTVRTYRARIVRKMGLGSSQALIRYAMRHNLAH